MLPKNKVMRIAVNDHYIRRRDKKVVVIDSVTGQGVEYRTENAKFKVSLDGFRKGFRYLNAEEKQREGITTDCGDATASSE